MSLHYEVKVTAVGEVRDKDGNLISSTPVESTGPHRRRGRDPGLANPEKEK